MHQVYSKMPDNLIRQGQLLNQVLDKVNMQGYVLNQFRIS